MAIKIPTRDPGATPSAAIDVTPSNAGQITAKADEQLALAFGQAGQTLAKIGAQGIQEVRKRKEKLKVEEDNITSLKLISQYERDNYQRSIQQSQRDITTEDITASDYVNPTKQYYDEADKQLSELLEGQPLSVQESVRKAVLNSTNQKGAALSQKEVQDRRAAELKELDNIGAVLQLSVRNNPMLLESSIADLQKGTAAWSIAANSGQLNKEAQAEKQRILQSQLVEAAVTGYANQGAFDAAEAIMSDDEIYEDYLEKGKRRDLNKYISNARLTKENEKKRVIKEGHDKFIDNLYTRLDKDPDSVSILDAQNDPDPRRRQETIDMITRYKSSFHKQSKSDGTVLAEFYGWLATDDPRATESYIKSMVANKGNRWLTGKEGMQAEQARKAHVKNKQEGRINPHTENLKTLVKEIDRDIVKGTEKGGITVTSGATQKTQLYLWAQDPANAGGDILKVYKDWYGEEKEQSWMHYLQAAASIFGLADRPESLTAAAADEAALNTMLQSLGEDKTVDSIVTSMGEMPEFKDMSEEERRELAKHRLRVKQQELKNQAGGLTKINVGNKVPTGTGVTPAPQEEPQEQETTDMFGGA